ncbi:hypothetical protein EAH_00067840 [Eimeria acervulina]|uniref:Uncharacterized protein n=1 Tax=Eimeria acervulina TaxID=5801 RepID=U6GHY5_EIMAC|nr:hypothetical protein EAH_00067840 [Eimeria acervulina]CDI78189.1 hypothetical protein EAH_00067840 [Eimeria acervulina]
MVAEPSHAEEPEGLVEEQESPASPTTTDKSIRIDAHEAASGRLPGHKDGKDYRGFSRLPSSVMRSRSTGEHEQQQQVKDAHSHPPASEGEHEQQQQVKDAHSHPPASEEEASPLPSVSTVTPPPSEDPLSLHDAWGLPMLDHFERTLPPGVKQGKDAIAEWLAKGHTGDEELVGMNLLLRNVMPLHWVEGDGPQQRLVHINKLLGGGGTAIVVEAEDMATHEVFAMRITRVHVKVGQVFDNDADFLLTVQRELVLGEELARILCATTLASNGEVIWLCY